MHGESLGNLLTLCVFGVLGLIAARRFAVPVRARTWVLLVIVVVVGGFVGVGTALLSVFGAGVYLNWAIVSFGLGALAGLLVRTAARRKAPGRAV